MKVLKVLFRDGRTIGYASKNPSVASAHMVEMPEAEFVEIDLPDKPEITESFQSEGKLLAI